MHANDPLNALSINAEKNVVYSTKTKASSDTQKNDVIAELKMSKDLDGIKKKREQEKNNVEVSSVNCMRYHWLLIIVWLITLFYSGQRSLC